MTALVVEKRRGRPRKNPSVMTLVTPKEVKRGRGRPRKVEVATTVVTQTCKKVAKRGRGRPELYNSSYIRAMKKIVKQHGLLKGQKIINAEGLIVNGKQRQITISLPTLSKYIKREQGGRVIQLKRGRPRLAA